jgi:hypothetical protein
LVHQKGNNLIYELGMLNRKAQDFQRFTLGLEDRVREEINKQYLEEQTQMTLSQELLRK